MNDQNIVDCFTLGIVKDIPEELSIITQNRDQLQIQNQNLKKALWAMSVGLGCVLIYTIIKSYGKKKNQKKTNPEQHRKQDQKHKEHYQSKRSVFSKTNR